jgi:predicted transcriptional regulator
MARKRFKPTEYKIEAEHETGTVLGPLEAEVMQVAWGFGDGAFTVRQVFEELKKARKIAYTTVMTTMNSLHRKGLLSRSVVKGKGGLLYMYQTTMTKGELDKQTIRDVLRSLWRNFGKEALTSSFIDEVETGREELERPEGGESSEERHD